MRKMLIPIALAATMACGVAQAQERSRGDWRGDGGTRGGATQTQRGEVDRVDARQARQAERIRNGVQSGDLTRREASALRSEQRGINRMERRANADGVVTPRESRRLEHAQDRASRHINQQRHDQQRAGGWRGHNRGNHYAYGRGHDRGNHYAYGRGHDRGHHYAYGRGHDRGHHYAYGRGHNQGSHYGSAHRFNHRAQLASRGRFGRR